MIVSATHNIEIFISFLGFFFCFFIFPCFLQLLYQKIYFLSRKFFYLSQLERDRFCFTNKILCFKFFKEWRHGFAIFF